LLPLVLNHFPLVFFQALAIRRDDAFSTTMLSNLIEWLMLDLAPGRFTLLIMCSIFWDILVLSYFCHFGEDGFSFILASLIFPHFSLLNTMAIAR